MLGVTKLGQRGQIRGVVVHTITGPTKNNLGTGLACLLFSHSLYPRRRRKKKFQYIVDIIQNESTIFDSIHSAPDSLPALCPLPFRLYLLLLVERSAFICTVRDRGIDRLGFSVCICVCVCVCKSYCGIGLSPPSGHP